MWPYCLPSQFLTNSSQFPAVSCQSLAGRLRSVENGRISSGKIATS
jgi:hypothetical protein